MKNKQIKTLTGLALLSALIIVLQFIGTLMPIRIGPVSISLVLVPIVIGAAMFGPSGGAVLGGVFGVMANIFCINGMDMGGAMVFQANPVMCILVVLLKGILAGFVSGLIYRAVSGKNPYIAMLLAAIACPVVNTGTFLIAMALFFKDVLTAWAGDKPVVYYVLTGLVVANFVPELALNVVLSPASARIMKILKK